MLVVVDSSENAGARVPLLLQAPAGANELQKPTEASISNISTTALEHQKHRDGTSKS